MLIKHGLILMGAAALLVGCASSADSGNGVQTPPGVAVLPLDWQVAQPGHNNSQLVHGLLLTDSAVTQAGQYVKTIAAVNPVTRQLAWSVPTAPGRINGERTSFAELGDKIVALIYNPAEGQAFDSRLNIYTQQGALLRSVPLPGYLTSAGYQLGSYVVGDQLVIAGGNMVYAYEAASLATDRPVLRWRKNYGDPQLPNVGNILTAISDDQGHTYIGTRDDRIRALNSDGTERWNLLTSAIGDTSHAPHVMGINGNRLYVQASDAGLQAYDLNTGKALWSKFTTGNYCPGVAASEALFMEIGGGKIYLGMFGGDCIPAFNELDGSQAWAFAPTAQVATFFNQPVYVRGVLYATNGLTYAIDTETGKQLAPL